MFQFRTDILRQRIEQRQKERLRKAEWRNRKRLENPEYFTRLRLIDAERKRVNRKKTDDEVPTTPKKTMPSYYKILSKSKQVNKILGASPQTHTSVLKHILKKTMKSPRKLSLISPMTKIITPPNVKKISTPDTSVSKELRRIAILRSKKKKDEAEAKAKILKSRFSTIKRIAYEASEDKHCVYRLLTTSPEKKKKKKRIKSKYKRKLTKSMTTEVLSFYENDEVSYCLPDVKYAGCRFMSMTIEEAYKMYLKKFSKERKVASKTFAALKPRWIKTMQETPMRGSRCDYCTNIGLLRSTIVGLGIKGIPLNHSASIEKMWCAFRSTCRDEGSVRNEKVTHDELPQRKCVEGKCGDCGVAKHQAEVTALNSELMNKLKTVNWVQWGKQEYTQTNGKKAKRPALLPFEGPACKLMGEYFKQLKKISLHQFFKVWQLRNYNLVKKHLQLGQVLIVQDFQQNLLLYANDEPKGVHWDHPQITVHPTSVFYRCKGDGCTEIIKEDLIHITADRTHDKYAVFNFFNTTLEHLRRKNVEIKELIIFTDNCTNQYKSRFTFHFLSMLDIPTTHHFYCSHHGKGPSDRAGGNFKRIIQRAVKANVRLLSTSAIEEYCRGHYDYQATCDGTGNEDSFPKHDKNARRSSRVTNVHSQFQCIRHGEILRPEDDESLKTLKGTQKAVQVVRNTGVTGVVEYRLFDCCCFGCVTHSGPCSQPEYADEWLIGSVTNHKKKDLLKFRHNFFPAIFDGGNMTNKVILQASSDESEDISDNYEGDVSDVESLQDEDQNVESITDTSSDEALSDVNPLPEENRNANDESDASSDSEVQMMKVMPAVRRL